MSKQTMKTKYVLCRNTYCTSLIKNDRTFCKSCQCPVAGCFGIVKKYRNKYCNEHTCIRCNRMTMALLNYEKNILDILCDDHQVVVDVAKLIIKYIGTTYFACRSHSCSLNSCTFLRENDSLWCNYHKDIIKCTKINCNSVPVSILDNNRKSILRYNRNKQHILLCRKHVLCKFPSCNNNILIRDDIHSDYCNLHTCGYYKCFRKVVSGRTCCDYHFCRVRKCFSAVEYKISKIENKYCNNHGCAIKHCTKSVKGKNNLCKTHRKFLRKKIDNRNTNFS